MIWLNLIIMAMAAIELLIAAEAALGAMNVAPLRSLRVVSPVTPRVLGTFMDGGFATWVPEDAKAEKGYFFFGFIANRGVTPSEGLFEVLTFGRALISDIDRINPPVSHFPFIMGDATPGKRVPRA